MKVYRISCISSAIFVLTIIMFIVWAVVSPSILPHHFIQDSFGRMEQKLLSSNTFEKDHMKLAVEYLLLLEKHNKENLLRKREK